MPAARKVDAPVQPRPAPSKTPAPAKPAGRRVGRPPRDARPTPANVDGQGLELAKELLEGRLASHSEASTSSPQPSAQAPQEPPPPEQPTELIFRLQRRGEGWGEEIIPYITVEQRPIAGKSKSKRTAAAAAAAAAATAPVETPAGDSTPQDWEVRRRLVAHAAFAPQPLHAHNMCSHLPPSPCCSRVSLNRT